MAEAGWSRAATEVLGSTFGLTFVRGLTPDEVITRLGGADPVMIRSADDAMGASEAVQEWVDENGGVHRSDLGNVAVTPAGQWTMIIKPNGFLCIDDEVIQALSADSELVSFFYSEHSFRVSAGQSTGARWSGSLPVICRSDTATMSDDSTHS